MEPIYRTTMLNHLVLSDGPQSVPWDGVRRAGWQVSRLCQAEVVKSPSDGRPKVETGRVAKSMTQGCECQSGAEHNVTAEQERVGSR